MESESLPTGLPSKQKSDCYLASLSPISDLILLRDDWISLSTSVKSSFFLSWEWVCTWLKVIKPEALVLRVTVSGKLVALGLVTHSQKRIVRLFSSRAVYFQQTGDELKDQIWPEYNSLLVDPEHEIAAVEAAIQHLRESFLAPDELRLGATLEKDVRLLDAHFDSRHDTWSSPAYSVNLSELRHQGAAYLDGLSRNTRHQINRSFRRYTDQGRGLSWEAASSAEQALEFFDAMGPMHIDRWGSALGQSGYANSYFVDFHRGLIASFWEIGIVDLICLRAADAVIGYFYNFKYNGTIYFYMSGLISEQDSKLKPGLCGHALLIEHYLAEGFDFYDFMGGTERYKKSLGVQHATLFQSSYRWTRYFFTVEEKLRKLKHLVRQDA